MSEWSYSRLSKYLRCPLAYFFEYELAIPKGFIPSNLILGSAVHEGLAAYHRSIQSGRPCDKETVLGTFLKAWIEREAKEKVRYASGEIKDDLLEEGGELIRTYLKEPPPQNVIAVETRFTSPIITSDGEVLDNQLLSIIDLVTREPPGLVITDFKTAGRSMSDAEADMSLQADCYIHNIGLHFDEPTRFRFTVLVKTKTPRVQHVNVDRAEDRTGRLGDLIRTVERAIRAEAFYPVETPLNCSACPYRRPCREWTAQPTEELIPTITMLEQSENVDGNQRQSRVRLPACQGG
jgi:putative RecB family exonuclease